MLLMSRWTSKQELASVCMPSAHAGEEAGVGAAVEAGGNAGVKAGGNAGVKVGCR